MRITFVTSELQKRLGQLGAVIARKSQENIYTNVRIFSVDGTVYLHGADSDSTLTIGLLPLKNADDSLKPIATVEDGVANVLLEYKRFNDTVQKLTAPEAVLTLKGETEALLSSGKHRSRYVCHPTEAFTELAVVQAVPTRDDIALDGSVFPLPGLKSQIEQVAFSIPATAGKFVSDAALLEVKDGVLNVVATDGRMMAVSSTKEPSLTTDVAMTIAKPALDLLVKLSGGTTVKIVDMDGQFVFATELEILTHGKTHSEFPPYRRIFPQTGDFKTKITLTDKTALAAALGRLNPSCFDELKVIIFTASGNSNELTLTAVKTDKQSTGDIFTDMADEVIDAAVEGNDVRFLLDINRLKQFTDRTEFPVMLLFKDGAHILDLHGNKGTQDEPTYRFLMLPLRDEGPSSTPLPPKA